MKYAGKLFLMIFIYLAFISCKKDQTGVITGKWNLVNDSVVSGTGPQIGIKNYIGVSGDYFDFRTNGYLYIKEGAKLDTLSYNVSFGNKILISSFGWSGSTSDITNLAAHNATIHAPNIINPGGYYERFVYLER